MFGFCFGVYEFVFVANVYAVCTGERIPAFKDALHKGFKEIILYVRQQKKILTLTNPHHDVAFAEGFSHNFTKKVTDIGKGIAGFSRRKSHKHSIGRFLVTAHIAEEKAVNLGKSFPSDKICTI